MFLIWSTCLPSPKKLPLSSAPSPRPTGHWHCTFTVSLLASTLPSQPHFSPTSSTYIFWDYSFQKTSWPPQRWLNFFNCLYIMFIWDLNLMYTFHCVVLVCLCILSPDPTNLSSSRTRIVPSLLGSPASSTKLGTNPVLSIWGGKEGRVCPKDYVWFQQRLLEHCAKMLVTDTVGSGAARVRVKCTGWGLWVLLIFSMSYQSHKASLGWEHNTPLSPAFGFSQHKSPRCYTSARKDSRLFWRQNFLKSFTDTVF